MATGRDNERLAGKYIFFVSQYYGLNFAMVKKILGYLLFIIVAVAVFTPCCVMDNCEGDQLKAAERADNDFAGTCSPFFSCAGCAAITCTPKTMLVPRHHQPKLTHVAFPAEYPLAAFQTEPWQPPRSVTML